MLGGWGCGLHGTCTTHDVVSLKGQQGQNDQDKNAQSMLGVYWNSSG